MLSLPIANMSMPCKTFDFASNFSKPWQNLENVLSLPVTWMLAGSRVQQVTTLRWKLRQATYPSVRRQPSSCQASFCRAQPHAQSHQTPSSTSSKDRFSQPKRWLPIWRIQPAPQRMQHVVLGLNCSSKYCCSRIRRDNFQVLHLTMD